MILDYFHTLSLIINFLSPTELFLSHEDTEKLHDFEEECMEDLHREKENKFLSSPEERIRVINERQVLIN